MKMNKFILAASLAVLALAGCTNLDVKPDSQYTEDPSLNSGIDPMIAVEGKMADVYFHLAGTLGRRYMEAQCLASDEFTCLAFDGGYYDDGTYAHQALHCSTYEDASLDWYSDVAAGITKANAVIEEYKTAPKLSAPGRAMRAYFTWMLMDSFGDTPIMDHVGSEGEVFDRQPRPDVARWIESELLEIIPLLSEDVDDNSYGKPNKWMAEALLVKLYINWPVYTAESVDEYEASEYYNEKLEDCIFYCEEIRGSEKFDLGPVEYRFKFAPDNGPHVKDFIYVMPYDAITRGGFQYARPRTFKDLKGKVPNYYGSSDAFSQSFGGNMVVTPEFASLFCLEGDQRNLSVLGGPVYIRDPKTLLPTDQPYIYKDNPVVFTKDIHLVKTDNTIDVGNTTESYCQGYHSIKWFIIPSDYNNGRNQGNDLPIFRYADILLTEAEALVRSGEPVRAGKPSAAELFNKVRGYAQAPQINGMPTLDDIYDERGRELFDENWRRNDMIRFGHFEDEFFPHYQDFPDANFDKRHRIFPVEKEMMDLNPSWQQNPGY